MTNLHNQPNAVEEARAGVRRSIDGYMRDLDKALDVFEAAVRADERAAAEASVALAARQVEAMQVVDTALMVRAEAAESKLAAAEVQVDAFGKDNHWLSLEREALQIKVEAAEAKLAYERAELARAVGWDEIRNDVEWRSAIVQVFNGQEAESKLAAAEEERDDLCRLFDLQHTRDLEAAALWRAESPVERELVMPDLGRLLEWLIARGNTAEATIAELRAVLVELQRHWRESGPLLTLDNAHPCDYEMSVVAAVLAPKPSDTKVTPN